MLIAAADGSSLRNPGPAGWAWYIDDDCWAAGGWPSGTNNKAELQAVLDLLEQTAPVAGQPLKVLCDSQYVINALTKWLPGWKRKGWKKADGQPVLNQDLLKALDRALAGREISFEWVKGHAGHAMNEAADARARAVATAYQNGTPIDRGPGFAGAAASQPAGAAGGAPLVIMADIGSPETCEPAPGPAAGTGGPTRSTSGGSAHAGPQPDGRLPSDRPPGESADPDLLVVADLEKALLTDEVRSDPARLRTLLDPQFSEFGASGRIWTRARMLAKATPLSMRVRYEPIGAHRLADDVILLRWRAVATHDEWLRSSVWRRAEGNWRLLFCQGTAVPKD